MTALIRVVSKRNIYYAGVVLGAIYWSMIASPRYCAQASLVVEERQNIGVSAAVSGRERYTLSKDGRALLGAWLKSEAPFRIIDARKPRQGLYNEASHFKRLLHIGSLRKSGDWSHWKIFEDDLKISEDAQFISLKFESFDAQASYLALKDIISSAKDYLIRHSEENDHLYRNRERFTKDYYENEIRRIELDPDTKYRSIVLSELSSLYQRRDRLTTNITNNKMEYAVKIGYYGNNTAALKGIATNIDMLRDYFVGVERDIGNAIKTLPSAELREVQLSTAVNAIAGNTLPDYSMENGVSMPQYKISMISGPNKFSQEFGPQRMRSFLITFILFSILYWIVKD